MHRIKPNGTVRLRGGLYNSIPVNEVRMMGVANPMFEMPGGSIRLAHDDGSKLSAYGGHWPGPVKRIVRGTKRHHNAAEQSGSSDTGFRLARTSLRFSEEYGEQGYGEQTARVVGDEWMAEPYLDSGHTVWKRDRAPDVGFRLARPDLIEVQETKGSGWPGSKPTRADSTALFADAEGTVLGFRLISDIDQNGESE